MKETINLHQKQMRHIGDELIYLASENYNFTDRKGKEEFHKHQQEEFLKLKMKQTNTRKIILTVTFKCNKLLLSQIRRLQMKYSLIFTKSWSNV